MKPLFIVFEGIDGSGKSTQCKIFHRHLQNKNIPSVKLFEPTQGQWGKKIRKILSSNEMPDNESLIDLFITDREEDCRENILPALQKGKNIVMDRYYFSNAAYQGNEEISPSEIVKNNLDKNFPKPDRVYFIDIPVEMAMERINRRNVSGGREIFEQTDFLEKVRENFLTIQDESFKIIDGTLSIEEITDEIIEDYAIINHGR